MARRREKRKKKGRGRKKKARWTIHAGAIGRPRTWTKIDQIVIEVHDRHPAKGAVRRMKLWLDSGGRGEGITV